MSDLIASLDSALAEAGEDIILRRVVGTAPNQVTVDVTCRARVDAIAYPASAEGPKDATFALIISPTQINDEQWPGGTVEALPPFNVDQRIPRVGGPDKILMRGENPRTIVFSDPKIIGGELVRIDLKVAG